MFLILKSYKPLTLFGGISLVLGGLGVLAGLAPVYAICAQPEQVVMRIPGALLAAMLVLLAVWSLGVGLILNSINLRLLELERLTTRPRNS